MAEASCQTTLTRPVTDYSCLIALYQLGMIAYTRTTDCSVHCWPHSLLQATCWLERTKVNHLAASSSNNKTRAFSSLRARWGQWVFTSASSPSLQSSSKTSSFYAGFSQTIACLRVASPEHEHLTEVCVTIRWLVNGPVTTVPLCYLCHSIVYGRLNWLDQLVAFKLIGRFVSLSPLLVHSSLPVFACSCLVNRHRSVRSTMPLQAGCLINAATMIDPIEQT